MGDATLERVNKLFDRFLDKNEQEALNAFGIFRRVLGAEGMSIHDLALSRPGQDYLDFMRESQQASTAEIEDLKAEIASLIGQAATLESRLRTASALNGTLTREKADAEAEAERLRQLLSRTAPAPVARAAKATTRPFVVTTGDGYQWENVLLPPDTQIRLRYKGEDHIANVVGTKVTHNGKEMSPWAFMKAIKRDHPKFPTLRTGNPFAELLVKRPCDTDWIQAAKLRKAAAIAS